MQTVKTKKFAELTCRITEGANTGETPDCLVILAHGFGAPGDDLVGIGNELQNAFPNELDGVRFVFPEAPLSLENDFGFPARAWWLINMQALTAAVAQGDFDSIENAVPDGMVEASNMFKDTLDELIAENKIEYSKLILGGFSQGAMLATNVTLNLEENPASLVLYSGMLLNKQVWHQLAIDRPALDVYQSHGTFDSIIPVVNARALEQLLRQSGHEVEFDEFQGDHTITMDGLQALVNRIVATKSSS